MSRGIETNPRFHEHPEDHEKIFRISRRKSHAGSSKLTAREQLAGPCTIHSFEDDWGRVRSGHTLRDCRLFNELANDLKKEKQKEARHNRRPEQPPPSSPEGRHSSLQGQVLMIQEGRVPRTQRDAYTLQARAAESINIVEVYQLHDTETSIMFSQDDHPPAVRRQGHAPLVLDAQIGGYGMDRIFMDGGSSMNIIFASTLQKMLIPRSVWRKSSTEVYGVVPRAAATSLGVIELEVVFGKRHNFAKHVLEFEVLDWQSQYHAILGRPAFAQFMAVPHYAYLKLKMPGSSGVLTINGSFIKSDQCDHEFHRISDTFEAKQELREIAMVTDKSTFPLANRSEYREYGRDFSIDSDTVTHQVHPTDPDKTVRVYAHLPEEQAAALVAFLRDEWEIFAWCPADMPGIPREFAEQALRIKPNMGPMKQALRRFSEPKRIAIGEEVNRLLDAQFIRETKKATWIANPVLVPKKDTEVLRMCVNYGPINKHCPKDHFPLPRIDQIIDSTAGCDLLSFLDAYSGYNQIKMKEEEEEHTSFITPYGVFCYQTMPFGLKNAGASYQQMMQACLRDQIDRNVQVYVDDIISKPTAQTRYSTTSARHSRPSTSTRLSS